MTLTLGDRLAEAEAALHALSIGKAVAEARDSSGESVRYTQANRGALVAYVNDLKAQLDPDGSGVAKRRPMRPVFG